jgi:hypothetical protein
VVREGPYLVDPWAAEIVEVKVEGLAFGLQLHCSPELEIDLDLGRGRVRGPEPEPEMALVQVRVIDHVEQRVATLSACALLEDGSLPRSMQSPGVMRSLTWYDDPRRSGEPHSPLHSAILGYLENW